RGGALPRWPDQRGEECAVVADVGADVEGAHAGTNRRLNPRRPGLFVASSCQQRFGDRPPTGVVHEHHAAWRRDRADGHRLYLATLEGSAAGVRVGCSITILSRGTPD